MQQFRPLPRFDEVEEAELVEEQPRATTDEFSALAAPTTGHVPILLLSGPQATPVTDQLIALAKKTPSTNEHPSLTSALQATMGTTGKTKRIVVIHADSKKKKSAQDKNAPARRMSPRQRHALVLFTILVILIAALTTLTPLSKDPNGFNLLQSFGNWIHDAQSALGIESHTVDLSTINLTANLPPMAIPNSPYVAIAEQDAIDAGISPVYFVRQITQESGFNINAVSVTNAQGIAQFEPSTAAGLGINPWDPKQALRGAAQLMARYAHQYGDYAKALAAYNAGSGGLQSAVNACGANWLHCAPAQTRDYIYRIMGIS